MVTSSTKENTPLLLLRGCLIMYLMARCKSMAVERFGCWHQKSGAQLPFFVLMVWMPSLRPCVIIHLLLLFNSGAAVH